MVGRRTRSIVRPLGAYGIIQGVRICEHVLIYNRITVIYNYTIGISLIAG